MPTYNLEKIRAAIEFLVHETYFSNHVKRIRNAITKTNPPLFEGDAAILNELIEVGRQDPLDLERLVELAEFKRDSQNDKQAALMAARRVRQNKVLAIHEILHNTKLDFEQRRTLIKEYQDKWAKEKQTFLNDAHYKYLMKFDRKPDWAQNNAFTKDFWIIVDSQLAELLEAARATRIKIDTARNKPRIVHIEKPQKTDQTAMAIAMQKILDKKF